MQFSNSSSAFAIILSVPVFLVSASFSLAASVRRESRQLLGRFVASPDVLDQVLSFLPSQLENQDANSRDLSAYVDRWTSVDYQSVGNWLNTQEAGALREVVLDRYVRTLAPHEPEAAREWAQTLVDEPKREKLLKDISEISR